MLIAIVQPLELSEWIPMHTLRHSAKRLHGIDHLFVATRNSRKVAIPGRSTTLTLIPIGMLVRKDRELIAAARVAVIGLYKLGHELIKRGAQAVSNVPNIDPPIQRRIAQDPNANGKHSDLGHRLGVDLVGLRSRKKFSALRSKLSVSIFSASHPRL
jgi:hypothetical protein